MSAPPALAVWAAYSHFSPLSAKLFLQRENCRDQFASCWPEPGRFYRGVWAAFLREVGMGQWGFFILISTYILETHVHQELLGRLAHGTLSSLVHAQPVSCCFFQINFIPFFPSSLSPHPNLILFTIKRGFNLFDHNGISWHGIAVGKKERFVCFFVLRLRSRQTPLSARFLELFSS